VIALARATGEPAFALVDRLTWDELLLWWAEIDQLNQEAANRE